MSQVSMRNVIVSNLIQLSGSFGFIALGSVCCLAAAWAWAGFPADIKPIIERLKASSSIVPLIGTASVAASSMLAGYVASRIAHSRPIIHGAISSCAWLLLILLIILLELPMPPPGSPPPGSSGSSSSVLIALLGMMLSVGPPLLGALGAVAAYLNRRHGGRGTWLSESESERYELSPRSCTPVFESKLAN